MRDLFVSSGETAYYHGPFFFGFDIVVELTKYETVYDRSNVRCRGGAN
jgi:hypothetical protein